MKLEKNLVMVLVVLMLLSDPVGPSGRSSEGTSGTVELGLMRDIYALVLKRGGAGTGARDLTTVKADPHMHTIHLVCKYKLYL